MSTEEENRDIERAEEYEKLTPRSTILGENKFEISTGLIIAARYADKLRRTALVLLGRMIPKDIIIRDISELNKKLYDEITSKKIDKLSVIRIVVTAHYDPNNKKILFDDVRIQRYYSEEECKKQFEEIAKENEKLKSEISEIKQKIQSILNSNMS
jgi:hypothetical protein